MDSVYSATISWSEPFFEGRPVIVLNCITFWPHAITWRKLLEKKIWRNVKKYKKIQTQRRCPLSPEPRRKDYFYNHCIINFKIIKNQFGLSYKIYLYWLRFFETDCRKDNFFLSRGIHFSLLLKICLNCGFKDDNNYFETPPPFKLSRSLLLL